MTTREDLISPQLHSCVMQVKAQGVPEDRAFAICTDALQRAGKLTDEDFKKLGEQEVAKMTHIVSHKKKKKKKKAITAPQPVAAYTSEEFEKLAQDAPEEIRDDLKKMGPKETAKLQAFPGGPGERFKNCVRQMRARGARDPEALCAFIGRKAGKIAEEKLDQYDDLKGVEILTTGVIRGREFKTTDLQEIAENTNRLIKEGLHNPPGKLGHDDAQAFARSSGLPATGWVDALRVQGNKLMADFTEVPKILMRAFREKLFRKISSEIYFDFPHPDTGAIMGKVLRAVAFLGQDIPQVKGLGDYLEEHGPQLVKFSDCEHESLHDVNINISVADGEQEPKPELEPVIAPELPTTPIEPAPGPIDAEGLAGRDLELFRIAEQAVERLAGSSIPELETERSVDGLLRYAGRVGAASISSSPEIRALSDDPEEFTAWLMARAGERGFILGAHKDDDEEEKKQRGLAQMDATKLQEELNASKGKAEKAEVEAKASNEKYAEAQKALDALKAKGRKEKIAAFVEKHKEYVTPAVEPIFTALCEAVGEEEKTVKLSEDKEEKLGGYALALCFAESLITAKVARFEELTKSAKEEADVSEKKGVKGANYRQELHKKAIAYQEKHEKVDYMDAVRIVSMEEPELLTKGDE